MRPNYLLLVLVSLLIAQLPLGAQAPCECRDKIYLNDEDRDLVHKFDVAASGMLTEVSGQGGPGSPWLAPGIITAPHGLAIDESGNVFIGQLNSVQNAQVVGPVFELRCDGTVVETDAIAPFEDFNFNVGSRNGVLYNPDPANNRLEAFDECTGQPIGFINLAPELANDFNLSWGFTIEEDTWYMVERARTGAVYTGSLDPALFNFAGTNSGSFLFNTGLTGNFAALAGMGITRDSDGNFFLVVNDLGGNGSQAEIIKYDASGNLITNVIDDNNGGAIAANGVPGFWGARGIVYSENTDLLYVSAFENCVAVFDTDLNQISEFNIGNPTAGKPKGIGIAFECCPGNAVTTIDTTVCLFEIGQEFDLGGLIGCDGAFCEGDWEELTASEAIDFDPCRETLTLNGDGCATLRSESLGGAGTTCGPAVVLLNICSTPVACGDFFWSGEDD